jgi:hypothetical protein
LTIQHELKTSLHDIVSTVLPFQFKSNTLRGNIAQVFDSAKKTDVSILSDVILFGDPDLNAAQGVIIYGQSKGFSPFYLKKKGSLFEVSSESLPYYYIMRQKSKFESLGIDLITHLPELIGDFRYEDAEYLVISEAPSTNFKFPNHSHNYAELIGKAVAEGYHLMADYEGHAEILNADQMTTGMIGKLTTFRENSENTIFTEKEIKFLEDGVLEKIIGAYKTPLFKRVPKIDKAIELDFHPLNNQYVITAFNNGEYDDRIYRYDFGGIWQNGIYFDLTKTGIMGAIVEDNGPLEFISELVESFVTNFNEIGNQLSGTDFGIQQEIDHDAYLFGYLHAIVNIGIGLYHDPVFENDPFGEINLNQNFREENYSEFRQGFLRVSALACSLLEEIYSVNQSELSYEFEPSGNMINLTQFEYAGENLSQYCTDQLEVMEQTRMMLENHGGFDTYELYGQQISQYFEGEGNFINVSDLGGQEPIPVETGIPVGNWQPPQPQYV